MYVDTGMHAACAKAQDSSVETITKFVEAGNPIAAGGSNGGGGGGGGGGGDGPPNLATGEPSDELTNLLAGITIELAGQKAALEQNIADQAPQVSPNAHQYHLGHQSQHPFDRSNLKARAVFSSHPLPLSPTLLHLHKPDFSVFFIDGVRTYVRTNPSEQTRRWSGSWRRTTPSKPRARPTP